MPTMATIAKTDRYRELKERYRKILLLYSTLSELRLHTNIQVSKEASGYYVRKVMNKYPGFFIPAMESMRKMFYISLYSYIGAYVGKGDKVMLRSSDKGSLANYLYSGTRRARKAKAVQEFEFMCLSHRKELEYLHKLRQSLAHYENEKITGGHLIFGDTETIEILNHLAEVLYLLGYQRGNKLDKFSYDNNHAMDVRGVLDSVAHDSPLKQEMRKRFNSKREEWIRS